MCYLQPELSNDIKYYTKNCLRNGLVAVESNDGATNKNRNDRSDSYFSVVFLVRNFIFAEKRGGSGMRIGVIVCSTDSKPHKCISMDYLVKLLVRLNAVYS